MYVKILSIQDEPLTNYRPEELSYSLMPHVFDGEQPRANFAKIRHTAIARLWENGWTPGSISWRVFRDDGRPLDIGENYE